MTLFPEHEWDFVKVSVERVKQAWQMHHDLLKNEQPMLLAFSGGKDSVSLYGVCKKASDELGLSFDSMFHMQYNITNLDPPELVRFVKTFPEKVYIHHPEKTFWKLLMEKKIPPQRAHRWCCAELKEVSSIRGGYTLTGVRHAESAKRSQREAFEIRGKTKADRILLNDNEDRRQTEYCSVKASYICNPIIDWTDEDVWSFIRHENLPYCSLYDEGFKRLGCIGCPLSDVKARNRDFERWPGYKAQYIRIFQRIVDYYKKPSGGGTEKAVAYNSLFRWAGYV